MYGVCGGETQLCCEQETINLRTMKTTEMPRRRMQSYFDYSTLLLIAINSSIQGVNAFGSFKLQV